MASLNPIVTRVIRKLLRKWKAEEGDTPYSINNGCCDTFAQEILDAINAVYTNDGYTAWGDEVPEKFIRGYNEDCYGHCFYCLNGVYFDSECPNGVTSPDFLPFYKRQRGG